MAFKVKHSILLLHRTDHGKLKNLFQYIETSPNKFGHLVNLNVSAISTIADQNISESKFIHCYQNNVPLFNLGNLNVFSAEDQFLFPFVFLLFFSDGSKFCCVQWSIKTQFWTEG